MIETVFILTFFPFTFSLAQRNTSSETWYWGEGVRGQKKSLLCRRAVEQFSGVKPEEGAIWHWWELDVFAGSLWGCSECLEGTKPCPGQGIWCLHRSKVLGFGAGGFLVPPHPAPQLSLPADPSLGSIELPVPSGRPLQSQPWAMGQLWKRQSSLSSLSSSCAGVWSECPALLLQGFTVHTSICLPPPSPLFPSLFFCRMLQGKENLWKRFQELFSLPWC